MSIHGMAGLLLLPAWLAGASVAVAGPTEALLDARTRAYDGNFRNDAAVMKAAIADFVRLAQDSTLRPYALYYAAWTEWVLTASHLEAQDRAAAMTSSRAAAEHARALVEMRPNVADFQSMLANALVSVAVVDSVRSRETFALITAPRRKALELGPSNPRVLIMDAGLIFYTPAERGGGQEKGLEQWRRAMELFESEAKSRPVDPLMPRWGRAEAYGWLASLYLNASPPRTDEARRAAKRALELRPDYWWVKARVMPRLKS